MEKNPSESVTVLSTLLQRIKWQVHAKDSSAGKVENRQAVPRIRPGTKHE